MSRGQASALWLIGRDGELAHSASPEHDKGALEVNIQDVSGNYVDALDADRYFGGHQGPPMAIGAHWH